MAGMEEGQSQQSKETTFTTSVPREAAPEKHIDLDTARSILQAIINTHESTINETTPLDQVAGYTTEQVRQAEKVVAQSLVEKSTYTFRHNPPMTVFLREKDTPQGELILSLKDEVVSLELTHDRGRLLENDYVLEQPEGNMEHTVGFTDYRPSGDRETLYDLNRQPPLQGIRHMWRGLRWMNANMLDWNNPHTIMPEQLDTLPPSQDKNKPARIP